MSVIDSALSKLRGMRAVHEEKANAKMQRFEEKASETLLDEFTSHLKVLAKPKKRKFARIARAAAFMENYGLGTTGLVKSNDDVTVTFVPSVRGREFITVLAPWYDQGAARASAPAQQSDAA